MHGVYILQPKADFRQLAELTGGEMRLDEIPDQSRMYMKWTVYIPLWTSISRIGWNSQTKIQYVIRRRPSGRWHWREHCVMKVSLPCILRICIVSISILYTTFLYLFHVSEAIKTKYTLILFFLPFLKITIYSQK